MKLVNAVMGIYQHHYLYTHDTPFWSVAGTALTMEHLFNCKKWGKHEVYEKEGRIICNICQLSWKENT